MFIIDSRGNKQPPHRIEDVKALLGCAQRWAVLASMTGKVLKNNPTPAREISEMLQRSKIKISSGCYPACEINCDLNSLEGKLLPHLLQMGDRYADWCLELLGKAATGSLTRQEINSIGINEEIIKLLPTDCLRSGCECKD